jgi:type II secretory pathway pseudopilin PulG
VTSPFPKILAAQQQARENAFRQQRLAIRQAQQGARSMSIAEAGWPLATWQKGSPRPTGRSRASGGT